MSVTDVIRIDDVYTTAGAKPAGVVDGAGTKWMDSSVDAYVTQDKLLWVSLTTRNLSEAQTAVTHAVPGMERAHIQSAKDARGELQAYVTADPQRWQEVRGHMANALAPQADLFRKKLRASTWEDTKPLIAGTGHYPPTKGMTVEGQKTMIMVAIHAATTRLQGRDRVSLGEPTIAWSRESLVEEETAPEEERLDLDTTRRLFPVAQASQARRVAARAPDGGRQPGAAPPKPHAQVRLQRKVVEESLEAGTEAPERARQKIQDTAGALAELRMAAELGEEWIDVLLDDEEPLPADLLLTMRAARQGPAREAAAGATKGFQDAVDITIPRRVKTEDINWYLKLAFRNTFEPLPESAEGKVRLQCTRKTADAMRKGVTIRGEKIKAHAKKKRDADSSDEEEPSDDDGVGARGVERERVQTRTARAARPRNGSRAATDVVATTGGQPATWWAPSARKSDVPAVARRDTSRKCAQGQWRRGQPSSETTANRGSLNRPRRTTTKGSGTKTQPRGTRGGRTQQGEGTLHKKAIPGPGTQWEPRPERRPEPPQEQRQAQGPEQGPARNAPRAAAARRVETRRSPGAETKGAAEARATAETAGPRLGTVKRGERMSPRGFPPHMPGKGKGFRRRPRTGSS